MAEEAVAAPGGAAADAVPAAAAGVGGAGAAEDKLAKYRVSLTFRGMPVTLQQAPRDKGDSEDNTGWCVWECSNLMLRFIQEDANLQEMGLSTDFSTLSILDLSAGAGLVSLACAAAGATVTATDIPAQLPQLADNVALAGPVISSRIAVKPLLWGEDVSAALGAATRYDLVLASDIAFIALRDKRTDLLQSTLLQLMASHTDRLIFGFEERLCDEEDEFMKEVAAAAAAAEAAAQGAKPAGEPRTRLACRELKGRWVRIEYEDSLKGAGGHPDTDLWNPSLFWEPPPIRIFVLERLRQEE